MHHVELSGRAMRDLRRLDHPVRRRILNLLEQDLAAEPQPPNLDVKQLVGRAPWLRLRRGEHPVLFRPLTEDEVAGCATSATEGFLVERIVDRRDLERAVATLTG
ncbi:MAG: hypothetical protein M0P31_07320 [Solirubrobacteraceae bacterium]|nr:hypothetical protein [Solirubrobacteraceae bacterium]